ncbi:MAG: YdcF family protein [Comamonas sp.]
MFVLSKLLSAITQPMFWVGMWCVLALCLSRRRAVTSRRMLWVGVLGTAMLGFQAIPDALLRSLENRYAIPAAQQLPEHAGVIVLGGALEHPSAWQMHGQVPLGQSVERMTVPVGWMHTLPHMELIFSGGEGRLLATGVTEGTLARQFYEEQVVDMQRVHIEQGSRTTRENALRVAQTLGERCHTQRWLLVTSAWHMARSVPEFEAVGCHVTPYPVDFRTGASTAWHEYHFADSLLRWQTALHEYLGQIAYRLTR